MEFDVGMIHHYNLTEEQVQVTIESYLPVSVKAGKIFVEAGKISDAIGYVEEGLFRSWFYDDEANEITTHFFSPGSLVISIESFNNRVPARENIVAAEDSLLRVITYEGMEALYEKVPQWRQICKDVSDMKGQEFLERSVQLQTLGAASRYRQFMKQYPEVMQKVPLKHIATYLGMDIATLSRIRKKI